MTTSNVTLPYPPAVKWTWWRDYYTPISLIVITVLFLLIGIPLWITSGVVVSNSPNGCKYLGNFIHTWLNCLLSRVYLNRSRYCIYV